jgi:hypothetical protein
MPDMKKKLGPLPVWAWGLIIGVGGLVYYYYSSGSTTAASTDSTTGILDPNAVDPNTGLTYGEEEAAAETPTDTSGDTTGESGAQTTTEDPTAEFGDFLNFLGEWNQFAQAMGWAPPGTSPATSTTTGSAGTKGAASHAKTPSVPKTPKTPKKPPPAPKKPAPKTITKVGGGFGGNAAVNRVKKVTGKKHKTTPPKTKGKPKGK